MQGSLLVNVTPERLKAVPDSSATTKASSGNVDIRVGLCYSRVNRTNASAGCFVIGPYLPLPIGRPSHSVTAMTSAAVPVRKHSSAA